VLAAGPQGGRVMRRWPPIAMRAGVRAPVRTWRRVKRTAADRVTSEGPLHRHVDLFPRELVAAHRDMKRVALHGEAAGAPVMPTPGLARASRAFFTGGGRSDMGEKARADADKVMEKLITVWRNGKTAK
jgi:hypothetical protein